MLGRQARVVVVSSSFPYTLKPIGLIYSPRAQASRDLSASFHLPTEPQLSFHTLISPGRRGMKMKAKGGGGRFPVSGPGGGGGGGNGGGGERRRYRRWFGEGGGGGPRDQEKSPSSASTPIPAPLSPLEPSFNSIVCSRVLFCIQCLGKVNCGGFPVLLGFDPNLKHPVAISIRLLVLNISSYIPRTHTHIARFDLILFSAIIAIFLFSTYVRPSARSFPENQIA